MPTVLILIFTLLIMVTVIPYAFSNVIKQLQAVRLLEQQQEGGFLITFNQTFKQCITMLVSHWLPFDS